MAINTKHLICITFSQIHQNPIPSTYVPRASNCQQRQTGFQPKIAQSKRLAFPKQQLDLKQANTNLFKKFKIRQFLQSDTKNPMFFIINLNTDFELISSM